MGLFEKLKNGLARTRELTVGKLSEFLSGKKVDEDMLEELEEALLEADVGVNSVDQLIETIRAQVKLDKSCTSVQIGDLLRSELSTMMMGPESMGSARLTKKPWVIILVGVNGSGKTTTAGKLAQMFSMSGKTTAIAAADTFRAAAIEQVEVWAKRSGARLIKQATGADPAAVTFDAYQSVLARKEDVLIVDTAGRLQDKHNLMQELGKITNVLKRFDVNLPHEVLLILDAITGQNGLSQAHGFTRTAGVTGIVVTKLDGSAKGGVIIPILRDLQLPIEFIGLGEGVNDLYPFEAKAYADALLAN